MQILTTVLMLFLFVACSEESKNSPDSGSSDNDKIVINDNDRSALPGEDSDEKITTDTILKDSDEFEKIDNVSDIVDEDKDLTSDIDTDSDINSDTPKIGDFYVSIDGNDNNSGTKEFPWRTIQKGVDTISAGEILVVTAGDYDEKVTIKNSGTANDARLTLFSETSHTAKCRGFIVEGDYVTINGFDIEAGAVKGTGVFVNGADYVDILDNYVHECPSGGIDVSGTSIDNLATYARVINNHLDHNGGWGVHVVGSYVLIENNEVERTVQHHPKHEYTGFNGEDADGFRIFGDHHTIRGNYLHDLGNIEDPGNHQGLTDPNYPNDDYPHVDCIQTWDRAAYGGRPVMTDTLIERNHCRLTRASGKGIIVTAVDGTSRNLIIRNNIFEYRDIGLSISGGTFDNISIYNNLFKANLDDNPWGAAVRLNGITNLQVVNNMMIDGHAEARKIGGEGTIDYNLVWWSDGRNPTGTPSAQDHELWGEDPMFVSYNGEVGGDYHLLANSPAIGAGTMVDGLTEDFDGNPRSQNVTIGPFDYIQ